MFLLGDAQTSVGGEEAKRALTSKNKDDFKDFIFILERSRAGGGGGEGRGKRIKRTDSDDEEQAIQGARIAMRDL